MLVVVEGLTFTTNLLNLLVMDVIHTYDIVGQVVMVVIFFQYNTLKMMEVSVNIDNDRFDMLMVDVIFFDTGLA